MLRDLGGYARWWTLVEVTPLAGGALIAPGGRFRFTGRRPGGEVVGWTAEVLEVDEPRRIELAYVAGDLAGRTAWELEEEAGATRVAYVYHGVVPLGAASRASFARYGTRLHSMAMREDALAGLARLLGGPGAELDDAVWRASVRERVARGVRALG